MREHRSAGRDLRARETDTAAEAAGRWVLGASAGWRRGGQDGQGRIAGRLYARLVRNSAAHRQPGEWEGQPAHGSGDRDIDLAAHGPRCGSRKAAPRRAPSSLPLRASPAAAYIAGNVQRPSSRAGPSERPIHRLSASLLPAGRRSNGQPWITSSTAFGFGGNGAESDTLVTI